MAKRWSVDTRSEAVRKLAKVLLAAADQPCSGDVLESVQTMEALVVERDALQAELGR